MEFIPYSRARELFIEKFKAIGLDTKLYGLHSLRIGGASAAAINDLPDRGRSMVVGSPRRPKILTVGKIFNTSS